MRHVRCIVQGSLVLLWLAPSLAYAQADAKARAEALFQEAQSLMKKGELSSACPKFAASEKLDPAVGTLLNLATCYERQGKVASAWASFREAASFAGRAGQEERQTYAQKRAAELEKKISKVVIRVAGAPAGLEVKLDGTVVDSSEWGTPLPLDPGSHAVAVSAPGKRAWSTTVEVGVEASRSEVGVPTLADEAAPTHAALPPTTPEPPSAPSSASPLKPLGIALGAAGIVGVGVAMGFGLNAKSKNDEALTHCPLSPACNDQEGVDLTNDARASATASTVAFVAGVVLFAGGVTMFLLAPSSKRSVTATVSPMFGPNVAGASLGGRF